MLDRQKDVLALEIEGLLQYTNQMDHKNFLLEFWFLNESFTLNKIKQLAKIPFQQLRSRKTQIFSVLNLEKAFDLWSLIMAIK